MDLIQEKFVIAIISIVVVLEDCNIHQLKLEALTTLRVLFT